MGLAPKIQDFEDAGFNPFTAHKEGGGEGNVKNWYPELRRLRELNPVFDGDIKTHFRTEADITLKGVRHVAILGAREARTVLTETDTYSNKIYIPNLGQYFGRSITTMDNPEHARYRRFFQQLFSPKMVAQWGEKIIPGVIERLIEGFAAKGRADLVSELTLVFPFYFIHELLALPAEDRDIFHRLAIGQVALTFDEEHGNEAISKLKAYLSEMVQARRTAPVEGDFMSMIATAELEGERLPDEIVVSFFRQLMNAGGDTSFHGSSSILMGLLTHPDQMEAIKKDRSLVPKAIEEGLRWEPPAPVISRTPKHPVNLCGVEVNPGDHMQVVLSAANHDPAEFQRPDEFDISRGSRGHSTFGLGPHMCIGQHLARLEINKALNALLDRLPRLRIDESMPRPEASGLMQRGPDAIHVRFD